MDFLGMFPAAGGLALFLYGMLTLEEGLSGLCAGRLPRFIKGLTGSPLRAVLAGIAVTALAQSSSAVTVMTVGLVEAGLLELRQAVGIIMGANVGTTVTAWLLCGTELTRLHFPAYLLKTDFLFPILALFGVGIRLFSRSPKKKNGADILIGFSLLLFGMDAMSGALRPIAGRPEAEELFLRLSNPVAGMLAGMLLTAVIQSSSASVGILQALGQNGAVCYGAAVPVLLGQNIGTCVTALLSCIGSSRRALRTALVHLYFNLAGALCFLAVFYLLNAIPTLSVLKETATPVGIAAIHTVLNLSSALILLPFSGGLERLVCLSAGGAPQTAAGRPRSDSGRV